MLFKCPLLILVATCSRYQTAPHGADWSQYDTVCYRDVPRKQADCSSYKSAPEFAICFTGTCTSDLTGQNRRQIGE